MRFTVILKGGDPELDGLFVRYVEAPNAEVAVDKAAGEALLSRTPPLPSHDPEDEFGRPAYAVRFVFAGHHDDVSPE